MIPDKIKQEIQDSYSKFLESTGFAPRPTQKHMIAAIARQLMHSRPLEKILAVEAGTGTGKTLAYLLAAVPIARETGKTLVISTGTIALQEQLVNKDIPDAISKAGLSFGYQLVKGRGRYLCQLKLENLLASDADADQMSMYLEGDIQAFSADRLKLYQSMEHALAHSEWDGDRDTWDDAIREDDWRPLTSDRYQCIGRSCDHVNQCAFFSARNQLEESLVLVANHDLVLSDLALGGGAILPPVEDCIYIFDEAHHLGEKARKHFASRFRLGTASANLDQMVELLPRLKSEAVSIKGIPSSVDEIQAQISKLIEQLDPVRSLLAEEIASVDLSDKNFGRFGIQRMEKRYPKGVLPPELQEIAQELSTTFTRVTGRLELVSDALKPREEDDDEVPANVSARSAWYPIVGQWLARIEGASALWVNYGIRGESIADYARWVRLHESADDYELFASPIVAGDMLYDQVWSRAAGAVLTSATLTALGSFDRLKLRSGLEEETACLMLPSPFDYANKAQLCIPRESADPKDPYAHDAWLIDNLPEILDANAGNLVLFTSARQMDEVFDHLDNDWQKRILVQGTRSKQRLIDLHKKRIDEGTGNTIFGLASFAEGIDLPGKYCEHVLIAKIPFGVPDEPEEEAFAEWVEARGGNSFRDISLADASLRLVQAVGRLLRSETDSGKVTITDNRLLTKSYGRQLLSALPPMPVKENWEAVLQGD